MSAFGVLVCLVGSALALFVLAMVVGATPERRRVREELTYREYESDQMRALQRASWLSGVENLRRPLEERDKEPFGPIFRKHLDEQFKLLRSLRP